MPGEVGHDSIIQVSLDTLRFAYKPKKSVHDGIFLTPHTALEHPDRRDTYIRLLFIDYRSSFNISVPSKLLVKLRGRGLFSPICNCLI